jgi:Protein of unknown function (DUF1353)
MKLSAVILILCLIVIFSFDRPTTSSAQQEGGRVKSASRPPENRERENREREIRELKRDSVQPREDRANRRIASIPGWRTAQSDFHKIDIQTRASNSRVNVTIKGDQESSGTITVRVKPDDASSNLVLSEYSFDLSIINVPDDLISDILKIVFLRPSTVGQLDGVKVKQLGATPNYEVVDDYVYQARDYKIIVPKGFVYDRASIPRIFWLIIDKDSLSNVAPLFHDLLYRYGGRLPPSLVSPYREFSREDTDKLFYDLMVKCGVVQWRSVAAYEAVRNFAESHWNKHNSQ